MPSQKPRNHRKQRDSRRSDGDNRSSQDSRTEAVGTRTDDSVTPSVSRFTKIAWLLVGLVAVLGGWFLFGPSTASTSTIQAPKAIGPDPRVMPRSGYSGPAAFSSARSTIAVSPDGSLTAWAFDSTELTVCNGIWTADEPDLSQLITLRGHSEPIKQIVFSGFGDLIATASADSTVKIWETGSGQQLVSLNDHNGPVNAVAFSPDGVSMASGGQDGTIRLWDAYGGLPLTTLCELESPITALNYSPTANWLAAADESGSLKLWELETGREILNLEIPESQIIDSADAEPAISQHARIDRIMFSPDGKQLVATAGDDTLLRWRASDGKVLPKVHLEDNRILSFAFSPGGEAIATSGIDGRLVVTQIRNESILGEITTPEIPLLLQYAVDGVLRWSKFDRDDLAKIGFRDLAAEIAARSQLAEGAIGGFVIPEGMTISVFADETMVANPAALCFDRNGALYVAETFRFDTEVGLGYAGRETWLLDDLKNQTPSDRLAMYEKYAADREDGMAPHTKFSERIRRLVDTNGDGKADQTTIFADGFREPLTGTGTGLLAVDGHLLYTCIPDLWQLTDTDEDGVSDERDSLISGFGVKASLPHGLHGLTRGPDGKIYFSVGDRGYKIKTAEGEVLHNPSTGAILRCNPDGSQLEEIARGFRNPQELAFDDFGNLFTCDNNSNQGDQARLIYVMPGTEAGWEMAFETMPAEFPLGPWNLDRLWETASTHDSAAVLPAIAHLGIGPAGFAAYPGVGLPDRYQQHFFLCDFADAPETSGIRSFALEPSGAGFIIRDQHTFVGNILPTDIEFGPDQSVYISDWIRGADSDGLGRIYKADFEHATTNYESAHWLTADLSAKTVEQLIAKLEHPDRRVRQRVHLQLAKRGTMAVPGLQERLIDQGSQLARIHTIWALGIIANKIPTERENCLTTIATCIQDPDAEIRVQCCKVLGEARYLASSKQLIDALKDDNPRVCASAAFALGNLQINDATEPLLELLKRNTNQDPFLRHAASYALSKTATAQDLALNVTAESELIRMGVLLAMRRNRSPDLIGFLNDSDPKIVIEAARAIHDLKIGQGQEALASKLNGYRTEETFLRRAINANLRQRDIESAKRLTVFIDNAKVPDHIKEVALDAIRNWKTPPIRDPVMGTAWEDATVITQEQIQSALTTVLQPWLINCLVQVQYPHQEELMLIADSLEFQVGDISWIGDAQRPVNVRLSLLNQLKKRDDPKVDQAIQIAARSHDGPLRIRAAELMATKDPDSACEVLTEIIEQKRAEHSVTDQQAALVAIGKINAPQVDQLLTQMLSDLIVGKVPPPLKYEVLSIANERQDANVQKQLAEVLQFLGQQQTLAAKYQAVLHGGSPERGRLLFEHHTALQCVRCHKVDQLGGKVGPDLSRIGSKVSREYLLESLLMPEKQIAKGYEGVLVALDNGKTLSGVIESESDKVLNLIDGEGNAVEVTKSEIVQRRDGRSVMPANLLENINSSDLRDLIEYLASLQ